MKLVNLEVVGIKAEQLHGMLDKPLSDQRVWLALQNCGIAFQKSTVEEGRAVSRPTLVIEKCSPDTKIWVAICPAWRNPINKNGKALIPINLIRMTSRNRVKLTVCGMVKKVVKHWTLNKNDNLQASYALVDKSCNLSNFLLNVFYNQPHFEDPPVISQADIVIIFKMKVVEFKGKLSGEISSPHQIRRFSSSLDDPLEYTTLSPFSKITDKHRFAVHELRQWYKQSLERQESEEEEDTTSDNIDKGTVVEKNKKEKNREENEETEREKEKANKTVQEKEKEKQDETTGERNETEKNKEDTEIKVVKELKQDTKIKRKKVEKETIVNLSESTEDEEHSDEEFKMNNNGKKRKQENEVMGEELPRKRKMEASTFQNQAKKARLSPGKILEKVPVSPEQNRPTVENDSVSEEISSGSSGETESDSDSNGLSGESCQESRPTDDASGSKIKPSQESKSGDDETEKGPKRKYNQENKPAERDTSDSEESSDSGESSDSEIVLEDICYYAEGGIGSRMIGEMVTTGNQDNVTKKEKVEEKKMVKEIEVVREKEKEVPEMKEQIAKEKDILLQENEFSVGLMKEFIDKEIAQEKDTRTMKEGIATRMKERIAKVKEISMQEKEATRMKKLIAKEKEISLLENEVTGIKERIAKEKDMLLQEIEESGMKELIEKEIAQEKQLVEEKEEMGRKELMGENVVEVKEKKIDETKDCLEQTNSDSNEDSEVYMDDAGDEMQVNPEEQVDIGQVQLEGQVRQQKDKEEQNVAINVQDCQMHNETQDYLVQRTAQEHKKLVNSLETVVGQVKILTQKVVEKVVNLDEEKEVIDAKEDLKKEKEEIQKSKEEIKRIKQEIEKEQDKLKKDQEKINKEIELIRIQHREIQREKEEMEKQMEQIKKAKEKQEVYLVGKSRNKIAHKSLASHDSKSEITSTKKPRGDITNSTSETIPMEVENEPTLDTEITSLPSCSSGTNVVTGAKMRDVIANTSPSFDAEVHYIGNIGSQPFNLLCVVVEMGEISAHGMALSILRVADGTLSNENYVEYDLENCVGLPDTLTQRTRNIGSQTVDILCPVPLQDISHIQTYSCVILRHVQKHVVYKGEPGEMEYELSLNPCRSLVDVAPPDFPATIRLVKWAAEIKKQQQVSSGNITNEEYRARGANSPQSPILMGVLVPSG